MNKVFLLLLGAALIFSHSMNASAQEYIGATLVHRDDPNATIGVVCAHENELGVCDEFELTENREDGKTPAKILAHFRQASPEEVREASKGASKEFSESVNEQYAAIGFAATGTLVIITTFGRAYPLLLPAVLIGGAIDLAKSPLVLAAWLGHRLFVPNAKKKIAKALRFAMDPGQKGREVRVSERIFDSLVALHVNAAPTP